MAAFMLAACNSTVAGNPFVDAGDDGAGAGGSADDGGTGGGDGGGDDDDGGGIKYDVAPGTGGPGDESEEDCDEEVPPRDAMLKGVVWAPNQYIPVSGALVWVVDTRPEGIPNHVYCEECIEIPCEIPHVRTEADGSFSLPVTSGNGLYLAVQKGQFLRITQLDIEPGTKMLSAEMTSLPDHLAPDEGLYIPNIALNYGVFDRLEHTLGKLGLAQTEVDADRIQEKYIPGTEQWDTWENGLEPDTTYLGPLEDLVRDYSKMEKYHIIFVPCSMDVYESAFMEEQVLDNVRRWVEEGGKWYVADWSNELIDRPFGQYQTFFRDPSGDTDLDIYNSVGTVLDEDMLAWLEALPEDLKDINPLNFPKSGFPTITDLPRIDLVENWSGVEDTPHVHVPDGEGGQVDVGHNTWVEGPGYADVPPGIHPMAITGEYGCGRIMFTTFHTSKGGSYIGVTPQEMVLLYLILEIGVCQTPHDPPPEG
jgi:hypothetical protein